MQGILVITVHDLIDLRMKNLLTTLSHSLVLCVQENMLMRIHNFLFSSANVHL